MTAVRIKDALRRHVRREVENQVGVLAKTPMRQERWINSIYKGSNMESSAIKRTDSVSEQGGLTFAGIVRCLAASGGSLSDAKEIAQRNYGGNHAVTKAMAASRFDAGGALIPDSLASEVIHLLRPFSVVRQAGPRFIQAPRGTMTFPKITASASAAYISENTDIPISQPKVGGPVLSVKKMAALVPLSNELLQFGGSGVDAMVRDDLVMEIGRVEDVNFLRGDGTQNKPKGLRYQAATQNVLPASGDDTPEAVEADLVSLINALDDANVPMVRPGWVMSTRARNKLYNLRGETSGQLIFPEVRTGSLLGMPLYASNNIPNNLGGGSNATEVMLVDFNEIIVGEVEGIRIETSSDGAYLEGSSMVSAFSRDQTLIRCVLFHDLTTRHPEAIAVLTGVQWQND